ncbi:MAG: deoxyribodipyrimidine photo-lyase [Cyclobacteriaceae bacterium]|jgi:deoxyribodipyrimidine photo-lyase
MEKINIFWHRRDLRTSDNAGLYYALNDSLPVLPIFIFDTNILDKLEDKHDARVQFILNQLVRINKDYQNLKSGLMVFNCSPEKAFQTLMEKYEVNAIFTNRDYEPYAKERDQHISRKLNDNGIAFHDFKDHVIFEKREILTDNKEPYKVFTPYKNKWLDKLSKNKLEEFNTDQCLNNLFQYDSEALPSLEDLGFKESKIQIPGNSIKEEIIVNYGDDRDYPAKNGTSRLGVHLRFGTVSIRYAVKHARNLSEIWLSELIWRDFYMMVLSNHPNVVGNAFKPKYDRIPWINNQEHFDRWCAGKTGYPIVDAGMRELNATGYMHNRVRMVVASFLTKHLLIDWRWGEHYFAKKLLDFELSSNNGGWQWAAGTGTDAQPYFRVFNPTSQQDKFDKQMAYIQKWIPEINTSRYPAPIVEHKKARERAINTYKEAVS